MFFFGPMMLRDAYFMDDMKRSLWSEPFTPGRFLLHPRLYKTCFYSSFRFLSIMSLIRRLLELVHKVKDPPIQAKHNTMEYALELFSAKSWSSIREMTTFVSTLPTYGELLWGNFCDIFVWGQTEFGKTMEIHWPGNMRKMFQCVYWISERILP